MIKYYLKLMYNDCKGRLNIYNFYIQENKSDISVPKPQGLLWFTYFQN